MTEPIFLTLEEVFVIHGRSLAEHGGSEGIRDQGLIESALASAKNTFYYANGDLFDVAASYAYHLAESQAFIDGNKRTAVWQQWSSSPVTVFMPSRRDGNSTSQ